MKKKIFTTVTAVAMSIAMVSGTMAATARESGNVDGSSTTVTNTVPVNSNDASKIRQALGGDSAITDGNFDGEWNSTDFKMSGNGQKVMTYVLTPEKMNESLSLRAYTTDDSMTHAGFGDNEVVKILADLELDSTKTAWNGNYDNYDAKLKDASNPTIDQVLLECVSKIDASEQAQNEFGSFLSGVAFEGFGKNAGKDVYLTSEEGWGVFAVAMRDIVPLKAEYFEASGYAGNIDDVYDGDNGVIEAPYTELDSISDSNLKARAEAFEKMHDIIVTNNTHAEGVNDTNIGKGSTTVAGLYDLFKVAFPSDVTQSEFEKTCDHFGEIYTRRYSVTVSDKHGSEVMSDNGNGEYSDFVKELISSGVYHYQTATLQDARDTFGDKIELSTTKDGEKTWGFVLELYVSYK